MKKIIITFAVVCFLLGIWAFSWQRNQADKLIAVFDFNRNGQLEREEVGATVKLNFSKFDSDSDGSLSPAEVRGYARYAVLRGIRIKLSARGYPKAILEGPVTHDRVQLAVEEMVRRLDLPGAVLIVGRNGRQIYQVSVGDFAEDTQVPVASASKWVSSVVMMKAVEARHINLDSPLSKLMPSLERHWSTVTFRQLLNFSSGVGTGSLLGMSPEVPFEKTFERLIKRPSHNVPGVEFTYGGISMQIAGYLTQEAVGMSWQSLFESLVAEPAGMTSSRYIHPVFYEDNAIVKSPNIAAGLHTTARDYFNFLIALSRHKGTDSLLLSGDSLAEIETDYSKGLEQYLRPEGVEKDWSYGLGVWCERATAPGSACRTVSSAGAFGTFPWIDRDSGYFGVLLTLGNIKTVMPFALHIRQLATQLD